MLESRAENSAIPSSILPKQMVCCGLHPNREVLWKVKIFRIKSGEISENYVKICRSGLDRHAGLQASQKFAWKFCITVSTVSSWV